MKTDARVKYTKMVLKKALLELMQHKPVNKITVKEICERAELNRATFYAHYSDCFDLLESIEEELFGQFERSMQLSLIHIFCSLCWQEPFFWICLARIAVVW